MKHFIAAALLLVSVSAARAEGESTPLFDGKTLTGWSAFDGKPIEGWVVEDGGVLVNPMIVDGQVLDEAVRKRNIVLNNSIAFPFSAIVGYYLNVLFVFKPGKLSRSMEMILFFLVAAIGFFPGLWVVDYLVGRYHTPSTVATLAFIFTSFMVNFVCRKFIIFKK
jgi:putative flippase GtrA